MSSLSNTPRARILVVDDEESMRWFLQKGLTRHGYQVEAATDAEACLRALSQRAFDLLVVDVRMPGMSGTELLAAVREKNPAQLVILITAFGSIPAAVDAVKRGAFDYISKPFEVQELAAVVERALQTRRADAVATGGSASLVAESPGMRAVAAAIDRVKDADVHVLITGESGVGKERVARALHDRSLRKAGPFVAVNCAAIPEQLLESELFGHVPGSFTGAVTKRVGHAARADGGTLFLDEIAELRHEAQTKLERFLQEREFTPLGADTAVKVDVRVVAATSRDLDAMVQEGRFRRELYFRLAVVPIEVPPLRERHDDVPALISQALERLTARPGCKVEGFSMEAMAALQGYGWPGNVRELHNLVERAVVLNSDKETIEYDDLPEEVRTAGRVKLTSEFGGVVGYDEALAAFERQYLEGVLQRAQGNMSEAARVAGLSRGHLHRKVKQLGIVPDAFRR